MVLCCDDKSQCQALERTQPGLPLGIALARTLAVIMHAMMMDGTEFAMA